MIDRWTVLESENSWNLSLQESCFRAEHRHPFQAMMSMRTDHQAAFWLTDSVELLTSTFGDVLQ